MPSATTRSIHAICTLAAGTNSTIGWLLTADSLGRGVEVTTASLAGARIRTRLAAFDSFSAAKGTSMLAYDYPLLGIFWSIVILFMFIAVAYIVVYTLIDNFRRHDHSGLAKAGWLLLIIVLPLLGALIYIVVRPEMRNPPLAPQFATS